ncbi:UNVERIFIED_CONTAM: hypothetical protein K2H54_046782 [Gekko kuhli]
MDDGGRGGDPWQRRGSGEKNGEGSGCSDDGSNWSRILDDTAGRDGQRQYGQRPAFCSCAPGSEAERSHYRAEKWKRSNGGYANGLGAIQEHHCQKKNKTNERKMRTGYPEAFSKLILPEFTSLWEQVSVEYSKL